MDPLSLLLIGGAISFGANLASDFTVAQYTRKPVQVLKRLREKGTAPENHHVERAAYRAHLAACEALIIEELKMYPQEAENTWAGIQPHYHALKALLGEISEDIKAISNKNYSQNLPEGVEAAFSRKSIEASFAEINDGEEFAELAGSVVEQALAILTERYRRKSLPERLVARIRDPKQGYLPTFHIFSVDELKGGDPEFRRIFIIKQSLEIRSALDQFQERSLAELEGIRETILMVSASINASQARIEAKLDQLVDAGFSDIQFDTFSSDQSNILHFSARKLALVGRTVELQKVRDFVNSGIQFCWTQIAGKAGMGKSRLALEAVLEARKNKWNAGFVNNVGIEKLAVIADSWQPEASTLIVVDYILGQERALERILAAFTGRSNLAHFVRLIIVERQNWRAHENNEVEFPVDQKINPFEALNMALSPTTASWFSDVCGNNKAVQDAFWKDGQIELKGLSNAEKVSVVREWSALAGSPTNLPDEAVLGLLQRIDADGRPLYAYFLGHFLSVQPINMNFNRDQVLQSVLERERLARWKKYFEGRPPYIFDDNSALRIAFYATLVGGCERSCIVPGQVWGEASGVDFQQALSIVGGDIFESIDGPNPIIQAIEPDLLGEFFVAKLILAKSSFILPVVDRAWIERPKRMTASVIRIAEDFPKREVLDQLAPTFYENVDFVQNFGANAAKKVFEVWPKGSLLPDWVVSCFEIGAHSREPDCMVLLATALYTGNGLKRDADRAISLFESAAELGEVSVYPVIIWHFADRTKPSFDPAKALAYSEKAARSGDPLAKFLFGVSLLDPNISSGQDSRAIELMNEAANENCVEAQLMLGNLYLEGNSVAADTSKANYWLIKAVGNGSMEAAYYFADQMLLGKFSGGSPTSKEIRQAIVYLERTAAAGYCKAFLRLATIFGTGEFGTKDQSKTLIYLEHAARCGSLAGMMQLADSYQHGKQGEKDYRKSYFWFEQAAELGDTWARCALGDFNLHGLGKEQSTEEAIKHYRIAANSMDPEICADLGRLLWQLADETTDLQAKRKAEKEAYTLFKRASVAGDAGAAIALSTCYLSAKGVARNERKGFKSMLRSAELGLKEAMIIIASFYQKGVGTKINIAKAQYWMAQSENADEIPKKRMYQFPEEY